VEIWTKIFFRCKLRADELTKISNTPNSRIMSIEVIKEGNVLRVLDCSEDIPEGSHLRLFTESEFKKLENERREMLNLQMPSFIRGDEDEDARELF